MNFFSQFFFSGQDEKEKFLFSIVPGHYKTLLEKDIFKTGIRIRGV